MNLRVLDMHGVQHPEIEAEIEDVATWRVNCGNYTYNNPLLDWE